MAANNSTAPTTLLSDFFIGLQEHYKWDHGGSIDVRTCKIRAKAKLPLMFVILTPDRGQEPSSELLPINFNELANAVKTGDTIFWSVPVHGK
ncbi:hypothetical protein ACFX2J_019611 [Malus domestica]